MSGLESRYRRMLRLLPAAYREQRAEEILSTLLDGAAPGQRRPRIAQAASLAALAVRLRSGAPGGGARAASVGEVLRRSALTGLAVQALYYTTSLCAVLVRSADGTAYAPPGATAALDGVLWLADAALPAAALACLAYGRRRTGRVLAVAGTVGLCAGTIQSLAMVGRIPPLFTAPLVASIVAALTMSLMSTSAVLLGFHRDAPGTTAPGRWLAVTAFSLCLVSATASVGQHLMDHGLWTNPLAGAKVRCLVTSPLAAALAGLFGVVRARRSAIWPAALLALSLPSVALLVSPAYVLFGYAPASRRFFGEPFMGTTWSQAAWETILTQAVLATALVWAVRRGRAAPPTQAGGRPDPA